MRATPHTLISNDQSQSEVDVAPAMSNLSDAVDHCLFSV